MRRKLEWLSRFVVLTTSSSIRRISGEERVVSKQAAGSPSDDSTDDDDDFSARLLRGMEEERQRRRDTPVSLNLDVSLQGMLQAIETGRDSKSSEQHSVGEADCKKGVTLRTLALEHLKKCLCDLPARECDCTQPLHVFADQLPMTATSAMFTHRRYTLLHYAALLGNYEACRLLLQHQHLDRWVDVLSAQDRWRLCPLSAAVLGGHFTVAKYLWFSGKDRFDLNFGHEICGLFFKKCSLSRIYWLWSLSKGINIWVNPGLVVAHAALNRKLHELVSDSPKIKWGFDPGQHLKKLLRSGRNAMMRVLDEVERAKLHLHLEDREKTGVFQDLCESLVGVCAVAGAKEVSQTVGAIHQIRRIAIEAFGLDPLFHFRPPHSRNGYLLAVFSLARDAFQQARCFAVANYLLGQGVDINGFGPNGATPLFGLVGRGSYTCTRFLLSRGADPNISSNGVYPISWTACNRWSPSRSKLRKLLLQYGADPSLERVIPKCDTPIAAAKIKKSLAALGLTRKVEKTSDPSVVRVSLVGETCSGLQLELGCMLSPKTFTPATDAAIYSAALRAMRLFDGATAGWVQDVSLQKLAVHWLRTRQKDPFSHYNLSLEGKYTLRIVPSSEYKALQVGHNSVQIKFRSSWNPLEEEVLLFDSGLLKYLNPEIEAFLGEDRTTLFFRNRLPFGVFSRIFDHAIQMKRMALLGANDDLDTLRRTCYDYPMQRPFHIR